MFDWLVEGRLPVYLILATAAVILLALWWRTRARGWLIAVAAIVGLIGLYALLDRLVETPYEQMVRKVREMATGVERKDPSSLNALLSDDFDYHGLRKSGLLAIADQRIRNGDVHEIVVWDFQRGESSDRTAIIIFHVKVKTAFTPDALFYRCHATFTQSPDGQWRMQTFRLFDPTRTNEEITVGFGPR